MTRRLQFFLAFVFSLLVVGQIQAQTAPPKLYGALYSSNNGQTTGIYSLMAEEDAVLTPVKADGTLIRSGVYVEGKYHTVVEVAESYSLVTYNPDTWETEGTAVVLSDVVIAMAHDHTTGTTYAIAKGSDNYQSLSTIDLATGSIAKIGALYDSQLPVIAPNAQGVALATASDGTLYMVSTGGRIYTVDKLSGASTRVFDMTSVSLNTTPPTADAVIDFETGKFYYIVYCPYPQTSTGLYEIDLVNKAYTMLTNFPNREKVAGLFIAGGSPPPPLPQPLPPVLIGTVIDATTAGFQRSVYSVTTDEPSQMSLLAVKPDMATWDAVNVDGKYYAYVWDGRYDDLTGEPVCRLTAYNPETWDIIGTPIYSNDLSLDDAIHGMTYDVSSGVVYAINGTTFVHRKSLGMLDLETGISTRIDTLRDAAGDYVSPQLLASDSKGNLYAINSDKLYSVNKKTAVMTEIGSTGLFPSALKILGGVVDPATDKFYWALYSSESKGIYVTDLSTAATELVYQFANGEEMTGLVVKDAMPADNAPGAVTELAFTPSANGALTGSLSFKIPSATAGGSPLSGAVGGVIMFAGQKHLFANAAPGSTFTFDNVALEEKGYVKFRVSVYNEAGMGAETGKRYYAGKDTPKTASNIALIADPSNGNKPKLTWTAPAEGVHGGFLDAANMKYNLLRLPDNVAVNALSETSYLDEMPAEMAAYYYRVTPYIEGEADFGISSLSNEVVFGDAFTIPYECVFNEENFKLWTDVDANNTDEHWSYTAQGALSPHNSMTVLSNWLISPTIMFSEAGVYRLTYTVKSNNKYRENSFNVALGTSVDVATHNVLKSYTQYVAADVTTETVEFIINEASTGVRHLSFQITGSPMSGMYFNNINIVMLSSNKAPNLVTDVTNTFNTSGNILPVLSFKAPVVDMEGNALTTLNSIEIYKDGSAAPAKAFDSPAIGAELTWEDAAATANAINEYAIVAINDNGKGIEYLYSVFAGTDTPKPVTDLVAVDDNGKAKLTWTAPVLGVRNGYVDVAALTYRITRNGASLVENHTGATYTDDTIDTSIQDTYVYTVEAKNSAGTSEPVSSNELAYGGAYPFPFIESFANGAFENQGWTTEIVSGNGDTWTLSNGTGLTLSPGAQDGDGGYIYFAAYDIAITKTRLITPSIDVEEASNPILRFWFYHNKINDSNNEALTITASKDGGAFEEVAPAIKLDDVTIGWELYEISLAGYEGSANLRIGFDAYTQFYGGNDISIDNIVIENQEVKDLIIYAVQPPVRLQAGATAPYYVQVRNSGVEKVSNYTVEIYKDNQKVAEKPGIEVSFGDVAEFILDVPAGLEEVDSQVVIRAEIKLEGDGKPSNNVSPDVALNVAPPMFAGAFGLEGEALEATIKLEWNAPIDPKTPVDVFDGFETYKAFIIENIGDWTVIDNDKKSTWYPSDYFQRWYDNRGAAMAFQVFNSAEIGVDWLGDFNGRTGKQVAISWSATLTSGATNNDDWLISPELVGGAQTIEFYARGINSSLKERFTAYYSTTDKETASFIKLSVGDYDEALSTGWTKYTYDLPEGARYFAIHRITPVAETALLVDDFLFFKSGGNATVSGYNVYRNDVKLNESLVSAAEYVDANPIEGANNYKVTAVYANGESAYSDVVSLYFEPNSIDQIQTLNAKVYTRDRLIVVETEAGVAVSVFHVSGAELYNSKSTGKEEFAVNAPGVYVVKIADKTTKVVIK